MASFPPSTPSNNLSDIFSAMNESTPIVSSPTPIIAQKRNHAAGPGSADNDNDNDNDTVPTFALPNQNVVMTVQRYGERKRLRPEQLTDVALFVQDPPAVREAKLLINVLHLENELGKIITSVPQFEVSPALEKNVHDLAIAVLLSSKIGAYKGSVPTNTLLEIIKKQCFDLPVGIENRPADFAKVITVVQDAFTQLRSKIKKALLASLKVHKRASGIAPGPQQQNIFQLTQGLVEGTQCTVSVELCARVALMRRTYLKESGLKFWNTLDTDLAEIRAEAKGNPKMVAKAFRHILAQDQAKHGVKDYEITETGVNEFQQTVNDLIDAGAADIASSVQQTDGEEPED
ncbi:hypothetical protein C8R45DRAFT_1186444 [Mycena sanguinolenta]|nr:hypothetical protein C8R45DRAFT_1186444 [Mycena sanguinolenta]